LVRVAVPQQILVPMDSGYGVLYPDQSLLEARHEADRYLSELRTAFTAEELTLHIDVREGDVAGAIVEAARQAQAPLVVMSSHGYSGVRRWLLGSVADKVLNVAPCPVWVVRASTPPQHMLITLDGSLLAEEVLQPALRVARCFGCKVTLLRVVPEINTSDVKTLESLERGLGRRMVDEATEDAASYLTLVADRCGDETVTLNTAVRSGPAADTILEYAERHAVDLVAMTTHGRTGLRRWIYGSVTHKVLDQLPVSMLVARSHQANLN
jgi:nucleotide-binding universal stress UspA family protein